MKKTPVHLLVLAVAAAALAGCGSSGNNSAANTPSATVTLTPANVDAVARAAANAAMTSASVAEVNPVTTESVRTGGPRLAATVRTRALHQLLFGLTREVVVDGALAKAGVASSDGPRAQALITRTENCDAGGTVVGVLDDRDNSNSVTSGDFLSVAFNQCRPNATDLIEGGVSATYSVVLIQPGFASATATVTYTQLHASSTEGDFSINGSFSYNLNRAGSVVTAQLSIGVNGLTASVTDASYSDSVTLHAGYTATATRDPFALPPGSATPGVGTLTVNGAISATSIGGTIVLSTPVTFRQFDIDPFPREGQLQVRGTNNALLQVTVLSTSTVRVQLDQNGDGAFEVDKDVPWTDLI